MNHRFTGFFTGPPKLRVFPPPLALSSNVCICVSCSNPFVTVNTTLVCDRGWWQIPKSGPVEKGGKCPFPQKNKINPNNLLLERQQTQEYTIISIFCPPSIFGPTAVPDIWLTLVKTYKSKSPRDYWYHFEIEAIKMKTFVLLALSSLASAQIGGQPRSK